MTVFARSAAEVKEWATGWSSKPNAPVLSVGQKGLLTGTLDRFVNGKENRYLVLGWLFNDAHNGSPISSKALSDGQWWALWEWADPFKEENHWVYRPEFPLEAALVLTEAIRNWEAVMLRVPPALRGEITPSDMLRAAVFYEQGVITAMLTEDGVPDVIGDVCAYTEEPPLVLEFFEKARRNARYNR